MSAGVQPALTPMDRRGRLARARAALSDVTADALLVTKLVNIRWLTGFTGSAAMLLVLDDDLVFVTDGRYGDQAAAQLAAATVDATIEVTTSPGGLLAGIRHDAHLGRVAVEADDLSWSAARTAGTDWFPGAELIPTSGLVEGLRAVKEDAEVERIEAAAAIADTAIAAVLSQVAPGVTETDIAVELEATMRRAGAEEPAFDTIVASGPNAAVPHHHPTFRPVRRGEVVIIDMGATVDGYRSDMTRTVAIGEIDATSRRLLEVVTAAQAAGVAAVAPGVTGRDADAAARTVIADAGLAERFVHPTGHGVGLEIHEALRLSATSDATLAAGHVVTVEPGVYLPDVGGVRIEDTVVVTEAGCRPLTATPHSLVVG